MKKIHLFLALLVFISSCEKDDMDIPVENKSNSKTENYFNTASKEEVLNHLNQSKSKSPQNIEIFYSEMRQEDLINSNEKITVIPARTKNKNYYSRVLIMKIESSIHSVVYSKHGKVEGEENKFSGEIVITTLDGEFINGFRVIKGTAVSRLRHKEDSLKGSGNCEFHSDGCWIDDDLPEVIVRKPIEPIQLKELYPPEDSGGNRNSPEWDGGSTGGGSLPPTSSNEEEEKVDNNLTDPCANNIWEELLNLSRQNGNDPSLLDQFNNETGLGLYFSEAILNLFESSDEFVYIVGNNSSVTGTGRTDPSVNFNSTIGKYEIYSDFNTTYLKTATRLSIARTMIHESIHAYLLYERRRDYTDHMHQSLNNYARRKGYLSSGDGNLIHHNFMAQFVDAIAYQLAVWDKQYGTGKYLGWQYYHDLAWGGLANYEVNGVEIFYDEFLAHNEDLRDRNRILDNIKNEAVNNINAKGNDCP